MTIVTVILGVGVAALMAYAGVRYFRRLVRLRCARLEDALRVYNNANASIGRHVTALESELREMRQRVAAMEGSGGRERLREAPAPQARQEDVMDGERRLSQLIRSRLGGLHL